MRNLRYYQELKPAIDAIAKISKILWQKDWAESYGGNISVNVTPLIKNRVYSNFRYYLVTATRAKSREISQNPEDYLVVMEKMDKQPEYQKVWGTSEATSEFLVHSQIHNYLEESGRPELVVFHSHPTDLVSLSLHPSINCSKSFSKAILNCHSENHRFFPQGLAYIPYMTPASPELAAASLKIIKNNDFALWQAHGSICIAKTLDEAFDMTDVVNKSARIFMNCLAAGFTPQLNYGEKA